MYCASAPEPLGQWAGLEQRALSVYAGAKKPAFSEVHGTGLAGVRG